MTETVIDTLPGHLRNLRMLKGLTQEEFAEKAEISYKYYQAIEAGRKLDLRLSTILRLAKAHAVEPWQLLNIAKTEEKTDVKRRVRPKKVNARVRSAGDE